MQVSRIRALRGPNLWSHHTAIEAVVACSESKIAIGSIPGFEARLRARFPDDGRPADLAEAAEASIPRQAAAGYTSFCFNPSQYTDDAAEIPALCRDLVARAGALAQCAAAAQ